MKKIIFLVLFLTFAACTTTKSPFNKTNNSYKDLTLSNGLKVLFIEDHSLPYISIGLLIKSGASHDPLSKSGLAEITASLLERGTKNKSATEIADEFGQLGTSFGADVGYDYSYFSTSGLSEHQNELISLFFEVITGASFSIREVERLKSEMVADIQRNYDKPAYVADRLYAQMLFGAHPYGRSVSGSIRDVRSFRQRDVIRNYLKYYRPNNAQLVLVGDINADLIKSLEAKLAMWQPRDMQIMRMPPLRSLSGVSLQLVNRDDLKQSEIRLGHYGVKRQINDYQTLSVAENILGRGMTSRLMSEIRVKRGLTYGIYSSFDARQDVGPFVISSSTRHEKVGELINETISVLNSFYSKGVTEKEVSEAISFLKGSFPTRVETPDQRAEMLVSLRFYGISDEYLTDYVKNLDKISMTDVNKVIKKYYHPDNLRVFIYGPRDKIIDQLRPIGAVEIKDYRELL
ncbi:MAG: hypothetical protein A2Z20_06685 [Bdellovibrionales bacterium RBG_16_40_8]|nr:MAG: hypothetical protein A2Z20_06685 [Bdellovibrionales bacterium RBG_16_40_8]